MRLWKAKSLSHGIRCPTGMVEHLPGLQCRLRHLPAPCPWACLARCWPLLRGGRRRPPAHDCFQAQPGPRVVGDAREPAAQLDHTGQLSPILAGLADRMGGFFIDGEHRRSLDPSAWMEQAEGCISSAWDDEVVQCGCTGMEFVQCKIAFVRRTNNRLCNEARLVSLSPATRMSLQDVSSPNLAASSEAAFFLACPLELEYYAGSGLSYKCFPVASALWVTTRSTAPKALAHEMETRCIIRFAECADIEIRIYISLC